jgi:2-oxoisovalerate dehydrogenase E1 component
MTAERRTTTDIDLRATFESLYLPRLIEEKMLRMIRQGRISKWFSGFGQEAIAVGVTMSLRDDDYILPMHRNLGVWTTREVPLRRLFAQLLGRDGGFTKGRDRTFHFGLQHKRIIGMISHVGAMVPVACGLGVASRYRKEGFVAACFIGEGSSREGDFHEALNLAAAWSLPVLFIIENNGYGLSTPTADAMAVADLAAAAAGYGMAGESVDGNDILAVCDAVRRAADRARKGNGPTLLEMKTFRMRGHEEASGTKYVPPSLIEDWSKKDPVDRLRSLVLAEGIFTEDEIEILRRTMESRIDQAVEYALSQELVTSDAETERADVYAASTVVPGPQNSSASEMRFIDAVSDGLREAMASDGDVVMLGQDIAEYGGVFKVTAGFLDHFGPERVLNTPIIESGAVGATMGMAIRDLKPVLEIQYADFISCGFNQIVNNLATTHFRWGQALNVTIRAPYGGNIGAGPFHSQCVEAWFCHVPGLKVVIPSTPADAKGLLISAIFDPNPVLFFEHKHLYRSVKGSVPNGFYGIELGRAHVARQGTDATVVTYGLGVHWALEEAAELASQGVEVEVIDLRTLIPWDAEAVIASVRKTGRMLILHEAPLTGGFGGEISSRISEAAFEYLDAPPIRIGAEDTPIPFSPNLEKEVYSARIKLAAGIRRLIKY